MIGPVLQFIMVENVGSYGIEIELPSTCETCLGFVEGAQSSIWLRSRLVGKTTALFSGLGSAVYFTGEESGLQWTACIFEEKKCYGVENGHGAVVKKERRCKMEIACQRARAEGQGSWCESFAKELVKRGLHDRNGMIALGRVRERFGETAGVAKLTDGFQFQWTSSDSLEDKIMIIATQITDIP